MPATLGIYVSAENEKLPGETHAWIVYQSEGQEPVEYGMRNEQEQVQHEQKTGSRDRVNPDSDVTINYENDPTTSWLSQPITPEQEQAFKDFLDKPQEFNMRRHNCSHWAIEAWQVATGEQLSNKQILRGEIETGVNSTIETPVGIQHSIKEKELTPEQTRHIQYKPDKQNELDADKERSGATGSAGFLGGLIDKLLPRTPEIQRDEPFIEMKSYEELYPDDENELER